MTFSPNIPQSGDSPSVSQGQILTNFQQLNTVFDADHFAFDDATALNRGHHKACQFTQQPVDLAVSLNPGGVLYAKNAGGGTNSGLCWRTNPTGIVYTITICLRGGNTFCPSGTTNVLDFTGRPAMAGWALAIDTATTSRTLMSPFYWDGAGTLSFPVGSGQLASGGTLVKFQSTGNFAQINTTANITVNTRFFGELT